MNVRSYMAFCLLKSESNKLKQVFKEGSLDPFKLGELSSEERNQIFQKYVSKDNATKINALFEGKLLLKNQERGFITWAKQITGISTQAKRDILSKIQKLDKVLDPAEGEQFLRDLASTRLGLGVSEVEAKSLSDLANRIAQNKEKSNEEGVFKSKEERLSYGQSVVDLENYYGDLKQEANKVTFREQPIQKIINTISEVPGALKSAVASLDNSLWGRQGVKVLLDPTTSKIWGRNFLKSFKDIAQSLGGKNVEDLVKADIYSRPNAINGKYKAGGYGLNILSEEAFPSSFPEKIPLLGRLYKASEVAYNAGAMRLRADLADRLIKIGEDNGLNMSDPKDAQGIGRLVSNITGRGSLGKGDVVAKEINVLLFSAKFLKSNLDVLTAHMTDPKVRQNPVARKLAVQSTMRIIGTIAMVLTLVKLFDPDRVEEDPRSTNFGKVKLFGRWTDITGGLGSLATLASRIVPTYRNGEWGFWYKSSAGNYQKLGTKYGGLTALDVVENFIEGKLSPIAGVFRDLWKGKDFSGKPITLKGELVNLTTPISVRNFMELSKDSTNPIDLVGSMMLDAMGASVSTFLPSQFDWENSTTKTLQQFKEKVGKEDFRKANDEFNSKYTEWLERVIKTEDYKNLSDDGKATVRSNGKEEIQDQILKGYGFKYKKDVKSPEEKKEDGLIKNLLKRSLSMIVPQAYASEGQIADSSMDERQKQIYDKMSNEYTTGEASYYNPTNPKETREGTDGTGAYGRKIEPGSVAFGNRFLHNVLKKGEQVFVQVKGFEDVKTPYGNGIFRVDDTMNERYNKKGQFNIDFHPQDFGDRKKKGRFPIEFRFVNPFKKLEKTGQYA